MQDRRVPSEHLGRWVEAFPHATVVRLEGVGHFVPEEGTEEAVRRMKEFLVQKRSELTSSAVHHDPATPIGTEAERG